MRAALPRVPCGNPFAHLVCGQEERWGSAHCMRAQGGEGRAVAGVHAAPPPIPVCAQPFTPRSERMANAAQADKGGGYVGKRVAHMQEGGGVGVRKAVPCRRKGE